MLAGVRPLASWQVTVRAANLCFRKVGARTL